MAGSMASMAYGEYRTTTDVDIVVELDHRQIPAILAAFPDPEFYVSEPAIREAISRGTQFNVIHPTSGLKIDFMVVEDEGFDGLQLKRRRRAAASASAQVWFASPEDVILKKLVYYREGQSDKHLRDIASMLKVIGPTLDRGHIEQWAMRLGVSELWRLVLDRAEGRAAGPSV